MEIKNVSDYLAEVSSRIGEHRKNNSFFVYRGESKKYPRTSGIPNIFRNNKLDINSQFERNLYLLLSQNGDEKKSLLHKAIDAQHDEFNSRLLDVSYNCLIALYFATTPYYHRAEDSSDKEDGIVYVYEIDEIYSPVGENTQKAFDATIKKDNEWFNDAFFARKHKFIDHNKQNKRIIAQQGAFLLFQGEGYCQIPKYMKNEITIPGGSKKQIRKELKDLFGIYTGSVYPEITNTVSYFSEKSMLVNAKPFDKVTEILSVVSELDKEVDYILRDGCDGDKTITVEKVMNNYRNDIENILVILDKDEEEGKQRIISYYNAIVTKYDSYYKGINNNTDVEVDFKQQLIDIE